jgi:hypothetical protein
MFLQWRHFFQKDLICASGQGFDGSPDRLVIYGGHADGRHAIFGGDRSLSEGKKVRVVRLEGQGERQDWQGDISRQGNPFQWASISSVGTLSLSETHPVQFPRTASGSIRMYQIIATYTTIQAGHTDGSFRRADFTTSNKTSPDPATKPAMMLYNPPSPIALRIGAATCDRTQPRIPRERPFTAITVDPLPWIKSSDWLDQLGIMDLRSESYGLPRYNPLDTMLCPNTSTCRS